MKRNLKKIIATVAVIGTFVVYIFSQRGSGQNNQPTATSSTDSLGQNSSASETINQISNPTSNPASSTVISTSKSTFTDGTYTGTVADAYFGPYEVQAVIKGGKLADVIFLKYPNDRDTSIRINTAAMPKLKSAAIVAQSAQINTISGATQTTQGFRESLQSALDQAKA